MQNIKTEILNTIPNKYHCHCIHIIFNALMILIGHLLKEKVNFSSDVNDDVMIILDARMRT